MYMRLLWLPVTLALICGVALGAARAEQLTVSQAVQIALGNHPSLKVAGFELQAAEAQLRGAKARVTPEVIVAPGIPWATGSDDVISVFQPLEVNGARRARTETATGQLAGSQAAAAASRSDLIRQVRQAYWDAALAQQIAGLDAGNVKYAEAVAEAAGTQVQLGNQPQVEAYKADVELARTRQQLYRSQAAAAQALAALNAALGRSPDTSVILAEQPSPVETEFQDAQLQALGLSQRPDLLAVQAAVRTAQGEVASARAARRTDVGIGGSVGPEGDGGLAISLTFPQLDWGGLKATEERAQALVKAAEQLAADSEQRRAEFSARYDELNREYQELQASATTRTERLEALSARRRGEDSVDNVIPLPVALSGTADSLAGDYDRLAAEWGVEPALATRIAPELERARA